VLVQNYNYKFSSLFDDTVHITWKCINVYLAANSGDSKSELRQSDGKVKKNIQHIHKDSAH
jgi:hypothetical protein